MQIQQLLRCCSQSQPFSPYMEPTVFRTNCFADRCEKSSLSMHTKLGQSRVLACAEAQPSNLPPCHSQGIERREVRLQLRSSAAALTAEVTENSSRNIRAAGSNLINSFHVRCPNVPALLSGTQ